MALAGVHGDERRQVYECLRFMRETERRLTTLRTTLSGMLELPVARRSQQSPASRRNTARQHGTPFSSEGKMFREMALLNFDQLSDASSMDGKALRHTGLTPPVSPKLPAQALRSSFHALPKGMPVAQTAKLDCDSPGGPGASLEPPLHALSGQGPFSAKPSVQPRGPVIDHTRDVQAPMANVPRLKSEDEMMSSFERPSMQSESREPDPSLDSHLPRANTSRSKSHLSVNEVMFFDRQKHRDGGSSTVAHSVAFGAKSWNKIGLERARSNMDQVAMGTRSENNVKEEEPRILNETLPTESHKNTVVMVPVGRRCKMPVLSPHGKARMAWLLLGFLFIIYEIFAIPVYIAFHVKTTPDESPVMFIIISVINTYFMLDIPLAFLSGYVDSHGRTIMNLRSIARHYRKTGFFFDLVAAVPWEWVGASFDDSDVQALGIVRSLRLLRLTRFLHLVKLKHSLDRFQSLVEANKLFTFFIGLTKTLSMLFAITHWAACVWYYVGRVREEARMQANLVDNISQPEMYVYCLYFAWTTMTTVGYGDVTPETFDEVCFVLGLLFISSVVFAYLMGSLTDLLVALNAESRALAERKTKLSRYLQWREVPDILVWKIRQHLLFLWNTNAGYDAFEVDIKNELPPVLRTELCNHVYGRVIRRAPWLSWMKDYPPCVKHLCNLVSSLFLDTGDTVFQMGELNVHVYVLLTGSVWISRNSYLFDSKFAVDGDTLDIDNEDMSIPRNVGSRWPDLEEQVAGLLRRASHKITSYVLSSRGGDQRHGVDSTRSELAVTKAAVAFQDSAARSLSRELTMHSGGGYRFNQKALETADIRLRRWELRMRSAALMVQRAWRRHMLRAEVGKERTSLGFGSGKLLSKTVEAPAYFGESCLWTPLDAWEVTEPAAYLYTARCVCRCELVHIPRAAILDVITRFSPWLAERFEFFRKAVVDLMEEEECNGRGPNRRPSLAYDHHAADLELPRLDASAELCSRGLRPWSTTPRSG